MNLDFDTNRFTVRLGKYRTGPASALADFSLQARAQDYRRRLSGSMIPITADQIGERIPGHGEYHVSRKCDGEFCLLFFDGKTVLSVNPGGTVRIGLPCFDEFCEILKSRKINSAVFAAELCVRSDGRERVHDVVGTARSPKKQRDLTELMIWVFDLLEIDSVQFNESKEVGERLEALLGKGVLARAVPSQTVRTNTGIRAFYDKFVAAENAEGVVVRSDQMGWFKVKPSHTIDCAVIGFSEGSNDRKGLLHDLLVSLVRKDGSFHTMGHIGGGFDEKERRDLLLDLKDKVVPSNYTEVNSDRVAYEMVKPELVVEMKCLDLISENTRGGEINRMVLGWDGTRYSGWRKMPFVSVISPQFLRIRDDKFPGFEDVSVSQVGKLVEIPEIETSAEDFQLPDSEILTREVYRKTLGDKQMLRKLLVWKTNKERSGEFPAFVVYYSDFSTGRKDPLGRDIKPARSAEQARAIFDDLLREAVKQGWSKVS